MNKSAVEALWESLANTASRVTPQDEHWHGILTQLNYEIYQLEELCHILYEDDDCNPGTKVWGRFAWTSEQLEVYKEIRHRVVKKLP